MAKSLVESARGDHEDSFGENSLDELDGPLTAEPPHPINWNQLTANEAEVEADWNRDDLVHEVGIGGWVTVDDLVGASEGSGGLVWPPKVVTQLALATEQQN